MLLFLAVGGPARGPESSELSELARRFIEGRLFSGFPPETLFALWGGSVMSCRSARALPLLFRFSVLTDVTLIGLGPRTPRWLRLPLEVLEMRLGGAAALVFPAFQSNHLLDCDGGKRSERVV